MLIKVDNIRNIKLNGYLFDVAEFLFGVEGNENDVERLASINFYFSLQTTLKTLKKSVSYLLLTTYRLRNILTDVIFYDTLYLTIRNDKERR